MVNCYVKWSGRKSMPVVLPLIPDGNVARIKLCIMHWETCFYCERRGSYRERKGGNCGVYLFTFPVFRALFGYFKTP
jgi:hypothetical protein